MKPIKKVFSTIAVALCCSLFVYARSDASIMRDLLQSYSGSSFPGVIQFANELEETSPASLYLGKALCLKGESLYRLGRYSDALDALEKACLSSRKEPEVCIASNFWKGRVEYEKGYYESSLKSFYEVVKIYSENFSNDGAREERTERFNRLAILYGGKNYFAISQFDKAIPLFENVIENGAVYSGSEYGDCLLCLFESYVNVSSYQRLLDVYEALPENGGFLSSDVKSKVTLLAGDAAVYLKQYKKGCEYYKSVFEGQESGYSVIAIQKLYSVSSMYPSETGINAAKLLEENKANLSDYDSVVSEVWIRLAMDAFNKGDYKTSLSYFDTAEKTFGKKRSIIGLYRAEINSRIQAVPARQMNEAVAVLDLYETAEDIDVPVSEKNDYYASYLSAYAKWYCIGGNYEKAVEYGKKSVSIFDAYSMTEKQKNETLYYYSLALYQLGKNKDALNVIKKNPSVSKQNYSSDSASSILYARLLIKDSKNKEAMDVYEKLYSSDSLSPSQIIDYADLLFSMGYITSAQRVALSSSDKESSYVAGLASFNKKDWKSAQEYFTKYISTSGKNPSAAFYLGYCQYKNGETLSSFNTLAKFARSNSSNNLCYNAHYTAALCAVLLSRFEDAGQEASLAADCAYSKEQKQEAILLSSSIYTDCAQYDKAIDVLKNSSYGNDEFAIRAKYQIAQIYALQGDIVQSDRGFQDITDRYGSTSFGDEAAFRRGEIYYSAGDYGAALSRYNTYLSKYKTGNFVDAALYYSGDCLFREGQYNRAEMQFLSLIKGYPESSYVYSARKSMVQVYKIQENFAGALAEAKSILNDYGSQAVKDSIPDEIKILNLYVRGESDEVVRLRLEYEKNGGGSSERGRACGTELAEKLFESPASMEEGLGLAQELVSSQKKNLSSEGEYAGRTTNIIAKYNRQNGHYKDAANLFLESAGFFRAAGNEEGSAMSLYNAVEAFDACSMTGDAVQTFNTLEELYPQSRYVSLARELVKDY